MTGVFARDHAGDGVVGEMRVELKAEEIFSFWRVGKLTKVLVASAFACS
jgi:hypothetical protein